MRSLAIDGVTATSRTRRRMLYRWRRHVLGAVIVAAGLVSSATGAHAVTIGAVDVTGSRNSSRTTSHDNLINQSGLSANYVSGVTDFESFLATTRHSKDIESSYFAGSRDDFILSFDLGSEEDIVGLGLWNSNSNIGTVERFNLYWDTDADRTNGLGMRIGGFTRTNRGSTLGQAFTFEVVTSRFFHLQTVGTPQSLFRSLGEAVFQGAQVPLPAPAAMLLAGLGMLGILRRKRARPAA